MSILPIQWGNGAFLKIHYLQRIPMKLLIISFCFLVLCQNIKGQAKPVLTMPQQAVLLEQAGSFYYVVKYASIDLDSSIIVASHSLGLSLLPLMTEGIPQEIPTTLSAWVDDADVTKGKSELFSLTGVRHMQALYLLGSWYAYQSTTHQDKMDSAIYYLNRARAEATNLREGLWIRRCTALLGKAYLGKNDTITGNDWLLRSIHECQQATDIVGEANKLEEVGHVFAFITNVS